MSGYIGPIPVPQGIQEKQTFTATAGQTTFNTNGYTDGAFINVFLNGVRLVNGTDYTATNGSDVVLTSGANADDVLDFETINDVQLVSNTSTTPIFKTSATLKNDTEEDTDGGRESTLIFQGEQSGGEISTLAEIEASHDGTSDDEKGDLIFRTNDGSDGSSPTERLRIDSNGSILTATLGTDNVHLGEGAGDSIASGGNNNVTIGKDAGTAITTGDNNIAIGYQALMTEDAHSNNTAVGYQALKTQNAGANAANTAIGYQAGLDLTDGHSSVFVGTLAGANVTTADYNTLVGYNTGGAVTTGEKNTALGAQALDTATTGFNCTAIGYNALTANTVSGAHVAVGYQALETFNTTNNSSEFNVAVGVQAGRLLTTGTYNTFIGPQAGYNITTGGKNTIIGQFDGNNGGLDLRTASNNVVLSDGDGNVGFRITSGQTNVFAGSTSTSGSFSTSTARAYLVGGGTSNYFWHTSADGNSNFYIQRTTATGTGNLLYFGFNASNVGSITCTTTNTAYNTSSDYRLKENVVDFTGGIERVKQLQPKRFSWIADELDSANTDGFLAHEVSDVVPEAVTGEKDAMTTDPDGNEIINTQQIDHSKLVPLLTAALQEAVTKIETLETEMTSVKSRLDALEAE